MPTISYKKTELKRLIRRKISDEQLAEVITLVKPNLESVEGGEISIEHTADRPDLFSAEGLARSISNYLGVRKGLSKYTVFKPKIEVKIRAPSVRPYMSAAVVRKVDMGKGFFESMIKMQELLSESIGRSRARVAIGIHDLDKIKGKIIYTGAQQSDKMTPLDHSEDMTLYDVIKKTDKGGTYGHIIKDAKLFPVFTDSEGIFSLPPILNSDRTKVTENTKNLFVEVTGVDKKAVNQVINILVTGFAERFSIEGVNLKFEKKSEVTPNLSEDVIEISAGLVNSKTGLNLSAKEITDLLKRMGYDALGGGDRMEVIVPAYRVDILHPVDIIEDIAIAYGYNNFRPEIPNISTVGSHLEIEKISKKAGISLVGFGFQEILSSALSSPADQFGKVGLPDTGVIRIKNPSSNEYTCVRKSLIPGLLKTLSANKHHEYPQNIFEIGDVVLPDKMEETLARNERRVAGVICHSKSGFAEIKTVVDGFMKNLGLGYSTKECNSDLYIPGRGIDMFVEKKFVGSFGELHPRVIQNWDIGMPTAAFEIVLENLA